MNNMNSSSISDDNSVSCTCECAEGPQCDEVLALSADRGSEIELVDQLPRELQILEPEALLADQTTEPRFNVDERQGLNSIPPLSPLPISRISDSIQSEYSISWSPSLLSLSIDIPTSPSSGCVQEDQRREQRLMERRELYSIPPSPSLPDSSFSDPLPVWARVCRCLIMSLPFLVFAVSTGWAVYRYCAAKTQPIYKKKIC